MKPISFLSIITLSLIICSCNPLAKKNTNDSDSKKELLEAELKLLEREKKILEQEKINLENSKTPIDEQAKLIEDNRVIKNRKDLDNSTNNNDYYSDAQSIISNFLNAENSRDFSYIYSFYSPSVRRYFGHNNPTYSSLGNMYQKAWNSTPYSKNNLISIDRINGNEFLVKINYQWSKNSNPSQVNSKYDNLKFVLDNDNKIIEVSSFN